MRAIREACRGYEAPRCKSKNRRARCVFCPSPGADSLVLDCDKIMGLRGMRGVMSDCIVVERHGGLHVVVVEFKGGSYSPEHARSQLVAGAHLALDLLAEARFRPEPHIHLVAVAPRHPPQQRKFLLRGPATVRGRRIRIHTARCGARFSQVIAGAQARPGP